LEHHELGALLIRRQFLQELAQREIKPFDEGRWTSIQEQKDAEPEKLVAGRSKWGKGRLLVGKVFFVSAPLYRWLTQASQALLKYPSEVRYSD
jgi:hypothetical protein